jgi:uncharacterized protein
MTPRAVPRRTPIIDFHAHPGVASAYEKVRAQFLPMLKEARSHGVDWICISTLADFAPSPTIQQLRESNDSTLRLMEEFPDAVIGLCYANPLCAEDSVKEISRCIDAGMGGIKLLTATACSDSRVDPIAWHAAELGVPILQHAWYKVDDQEARESTPADVATLAARCPKTMLVMAHLTGGGERGISDLIPHPNVHVDTCGSEPEAGVTELAVRKLGARRLIFGTDSGGRGYAASLGKVLGAKLTAKQKELILGGNAARLLARRLGR